MSKSQHLKLALATLLLASTLAVTPMEPAPPLHFKKKPQPLTQKAKWTPVTVVGLTSVGISTVYHFDSANAQAGFIIHDAANGQDSSVCYNQAIVNETIYGGIATGFSPQFCSQSSISRVDRAGHVLFINGDGSFFYSLAQGGLSASTVIQGGRFQEAIVNGVEFGATKSTDGGNNDYFRLFSRAADTQGNYPANFYALVANSTDDTFAQDPFNTLTLKKFDWNFKNTTDKVQFKNIEQVNFVANLGPQYILEAQWITGKGTTKARTPEEALSQTASKPACQYGAVNLRFFAKGPSTQYPQMYGGGGSLAFPCNLEANTRTYQGVVSFTNTLNYFYAINPDTGKIQVCNKTPKDLENVKNLTDFTRGCKTKINKDLILKAGEYYTAVGVLGAFNTDLTVVNIKNKSNVDTTLRQVVISFTGGDLPTIDTTTYYYTVYEQTIWRIKKKFNPGETLEASYYQPRRVFEPSSEEKQKEPVMF